MLFGKKKPKRLYYPTKSSWYKKPRRRPTVSRSRKVLKHNIRSRVAKFFKSAIYFVVLIVIAIIILLVLVFSSYFSITNIEVLREDFNVDTAAITNELNKYIGRNILTFPKKRMADTVRESFPEFALIKVQKVLPNTIQIQLESYPIIANLKAYYILPEAETLSEEDESIEKVMDALETAFELESKEEEEEIVPIEQKCLINSIGQVIFDKEEDLELMTITMNGLTQPVEDREIVIPQERMDYILDAIKYFNNLFEMQVRSIRYLPIAREVHIITDSRMAIWLTTAKDYKEQIDKLNIIYETAELDKEEIAYIDLRVKEKVIYCLAKSQCNR